MADLFELVLLRLIHCIRDGIIQEPQVMKYSWSSFFMLYPLLFFGVGLAATAETNLITDSHSQDKASDDDDNSIKDILSWVFVNTTAKTMQFIDKIMELPNGFFPLPENKEKKLEEKLKTSLFLSIIILLLLVVTRAKSA